MRYFRKFESVSHFKRAAFSKFINFITDVAGFFYGIALKALHRNEKFFVERDCTSAKSIAVLGNAPICRDVSTKIESMDLVIRMNTVRNFGKYSGYKFDIWVLCPIVPDQDLFQQRHAAHKALPSEVWFTVFGMPESRWDKVSGWGCHLRGVFSDNINRILLLSRIRQRYTVLGFRNFVRTMRKLSQFSTEFVNTPQPSTGILTIFYCLERFPAAKIYIAGFTFEGWEGHDWPAERALVAEAWRQGRLECLDGLDLSEPRNERQSHDAS